MKIPTNLMLRLEKPVEVQSGGKSYRSDNLYVWEIEGANDYWIAHGLLILLGEKNKIYYECKIRIHLIFPTEDIYVIMNTKYWRGYTIEAEPCNSSMFNQSKEQL